MAYGKWPAGFSRWLFRHRGEDTHIGDLANDASRDKEWPIKAKNFSDFYIHLCGTGAYETLLEAWGMYSGIDFIEVMEQAELYTEDIDLEEDCTCTLVDIFEQPPDGFIYIYGLYDDAVRYVGQTINPGQRLKQHIFNTANEQLRQWVDSLLAKGNYPLMVILATVPKSEAIKYEKAYIQAFEALYWDETLNIQLISKVG